MSLNLFVFEIIPVVRPPCAWILFLETAKHGERYGKVLPHGRIRITDFERSGLLVVANRFYQFGFYCAASHVCVPLCCETSNGLVCGLSIFFVASRTTSRFTTLRQLHM